MRLALAFGVIDEAGRTQHDLGRLIATPFVTIGVLSAFLVWEIVHVGSITLAVAVAAAGVAVAAFVVHRVGRRVDALSRYYEAMLETADEASRRAEAANRVKDEFLATLSHELRTPLNSVLGWSRLLASGKLDKEQTARAITAIERAGWAQARLIEDLLDISRVITGKLHIATRTTLVQPLVHQAVLSLHPAAQARDIDVETRVSPDVPPIEADPDRLRQMVWNLLSNAVKFTPSGGRVEIEVTADEGNVLIAVSDSGIGFDPDTAVHLFERFRQGDSSTTRRFGGLGLGLGIVRHLAELHGGTVSASSAGANRGARFEVRLPIAHVRPCMENARHQRSTPLLQGVSVLIVEDDPRDLDLLRASLEQFGAEVRSATSATEARDEFSREPPDVLLSDLRLPDCDGWELIREIRVLDRQAGRETPAAALSGLARMEDRRRTFEAGFQLHVTKPIDPVEVAAAVEQLSRKSHAAAAGDVEDQAPSEPAAAANPDRPE